MKLFGRSQKKRQPAPAASVLAANVLTVRSLEHLRIALGWSRKPVLRGEYLRTYNNLCDINDRKLRDAEVIGSACCNCEPGILLEIGTALGQTTALMAVNSPGSIVYTVNIPPEELADGGVLTTGGVPLDDIGRYYRVAGCNNVRQIYANTLNWTPEFGPIDVALVDGCHDADFVFNDTRKILEQSRPGSIVMWHDFNPELAAVYHWIDSVCTGIERLYAEGFLKGRILHLQDSWVGLYRVPGN